jgi:hypothetical protein
MTADHYTILWLTSESTGKRFPVAQFTADTDMVATGRVSLTGVENHDIVVTTLTDDELRDTKTDTAGYLRLEARINAQLERTDLVSCWLTAVEQPTYDVDVATLSFQEFRKLHRPPRLFYRDIYSPDGRAGVEQEVSRRAFERQGGKVLSIQPGHRPSPSSAVVGFRL